MNSSELSIWDKELTRFDLDRNSSNSLKLEQSKENDECSSTSNKLFNVDIDFDVKT